MFTSRTALYIPAIAALLVVNVACQDSKGTQRTASNMSAPANPSTDPLPTDTSANASPVTTTKDLLTKDELINYLRLAATTGKLLVSNKYKSSDATKYELYDDAIDFSQQNIIDFLKGKDAKESADAMLAYVEQRRTEFKIKEESWAKIQENTEKFYTDLGAQRDSGELFQNSPTEFIALLIKALPAEILGDLGDGFDVTSLIELAGNLFKKQ